MIGLTHINESIFQMSPVDRLQIALAKLKLKDMQLTDPQIKLLQESTCTISLIII